MSLRHVRARSRGIGRDALRALVALAVAVVGLVSLATPASAHHPEITGSIACDGTVSFTATAWEGTSGDYVRSRTNPDVRVHRSTDGGRTYGTEVARGAFSTSNGYSFSGSFAAGSSAPVLLRVKAYASWANGAGPGDARYVTLQPPTDCDVVAPAASLTHDCSSWSAVLDNTASNVEVAYVVTVDGAAQQVEVPAATTRTVSGAVTEDSTTTVSVASGGAVLAESTFTVDCEQPTPPPTPTPTPATTPTPTPTPAPTPTPTPTPDDTEVLGTSTGRAVGRLRVSCQGTVRAVLHNRSSQRATYTLRVARATKRITVAAGRTHRYVTSARPRQRVRLWLGDRLLASKRLPRACHAPTQLPETGFRS